MGRIFVLLLYVRFRFFKSRIWFYADTFILTIPYILIGTLLYIYNVIRTNKYSCVRLQMFKRYFLAKEIFLVDLTKWEMRSKRRSCLHLIVNFFVSGGIWMNEMITHMYHVHVQCLDLFLSYLKCILYHACRHFYARN